MSSNLYKSGATCIKEEAARVIDSDALMAQKAAFIARMTPKPADKDGFAQGLSADVLDVLTTEEPDADVSGEGEKIRMTRPRHRPYPKAPLRRN